MPEMKDWEVELAYFEHEQYCLSIAGAQAWADEINQKAGSTVAVVDAEGNPEVYKKGKAHAGT